MRLAVAVLLALMLPEVAAGAGPDPLDPALAGALADAYASNPELATARAKLRETDETLPRALSGWRPSVTFGSTVGASAIYDDFDTTHQPEHRLPNEEEAKIDQPLYTGGRVGAEVAQAEAMVRAERAALQASEASVLLDAATAYLDVARDQQIVALDRSQAAVLERSLSATREAATAGALTNADVAQAQARLADEQAEAALAEGTLARAQATYQQVVGKPPGALAMPATAISAPADRDAMLALVAGGNFDVAQAREAVEASRQGIDIAAAGLLPKLSLTAAAAYVANTDVQVYHQRDKILEGGMQITVPLYEAGKSAAATRQAKEATARAALQVDVVLTAVRAQAAAAFDELAAARRREAALAQSIEANEVAERGIARQQKAGARTVIEVLNARQELLAAKVKQVAARRDALVYAFQLQQLTGALGAAALGLPVTLYDPIQHYDATRDRWFGTDPAP